MATFAGMKAVKTRVSRTKMFLRQAALLLAVGQAALAAAPLLESDAPNTVAHVEAPGTQLHYVHDEASCAACVGHKLAGGVPLPHAPVADISPPRALRAPELVSRRNAPAEILPPSRGPPLFESSSRRA